ncbi:MAG TPA: 3'(2'),5'-bisphosphate nucleotidase CysQ [Nitrososphaera sp.]|nr:3'(2'),5'-bisphosphate nucleotidase CysQ [Nitrososphaera sp.]
MYKTDMKFPFNDVFPETELAFRAINEAAKKVVEIYNGGFEASEKEDKSPVTAADLESHRIITQFLRESSITIVSEEGEEEQPQGAGGSRTLSKFWLVDPLDGTREFVDKNGEFTIMVALVDEVDGKPKVGLISHPLAGSVYIAQRGQGSFKLSSTGGGEWTKLHVSSATTLEGSRAVISRSHVSAEELDFIGSLKLSGYTRLGSSLKALRICSGDAELYFAANTKIKQWDTCASYCLATEAGGVMTDMFGGDIVYRMGTAQHEKGIVITNGCIHDEFIKRCEPLRKKQFGS